MLYSADCVVVKRDLECYCKYMYVCMYWLFDGDVIVMVEWVVYDVFGKVVRLGQIWVGGECGLLTF